MKTGKKRKSDFKYGTVWRDPILQESYVVIENKSSGILIKWMADNTLITTRMKDCTHDEYVRELSSLEKELL